MATKLDSNKSEVNGLLDLLRDIEYSLKSPHNLERGRELLGAYQRITNRLRTIAPDKIPTRSGQLGPSSLAPVTQEPIQSAYGASSSISTPVEPNAALAAFQSLPGGPTFADGAIVSSTPQTLKGAPSPKQSGQTTPKAGQAPQSGGAPFPATPAERVSDTAAPLNPTPAQIESSPELAAFKAALEAPAPVFKGIGFTKAEQLALGFLAGLKGVESVAPIIAQRRAEAWQVYEAAKNAREDRLKGLYQVASISEEERKSKATMDATAAERAFQHDATLRRLDQGDKRLANDNQNPPPLHTAYDAQGRLLQYDAATDTFRPARLAGVGSEPIYKQPTEQTVIARTAFETTKENLRLIKDSALAAASGGLMERAQRTGERFLAHVPGSELMTSEAAALDYQAITNDLGTQLRVVYGAQGIRAIQEIKLLLKNIPPYGSSPELVNRRFSKIDAIIEKLESERARMQPAAFPPDQLRPPTPTPNDREAIKRRILERVLGAQP